MTFQRFPNSSALVVFDKFNNRYHLTNNLSSGDFVVTGELVLRQEFRVMRSMYLPRGFRLHEVWDTQLWSRFLFACTGYIQGHF